MNKQNNFNYVIHENSLCENKDGTQEFYRHVVSKYFYNRGYYEEVKRFMPNNKGLCRAKALTEKLNRQIRGLRKGGEGK